MVCSVFIFDASVFVYFLTCCIASSAHLPAAAHAWMACLCLFVPAKRNLYLQQRLQILPLPTVRRHVCVQHCTTVCVRTAITHIHVNKLMIDLCACATPCLPMHCGINKLIWHTCNDDSRQHKHHNTAHRMKSPWTRETRKKPPLGLSSQIDVNINHIATAAPTQ